MVRKCSIIECRGNYEKRQDSEEDNKVSVFRFPKDEKRLQLWLRKILQDNLTADKITDYMGICERHFDPRFIIREYSAAGPDGLIKTWSREAPALDPDAVPSIFPNTPSYLSSAPPPKRKAPDERRAAGRQLGTRQPFNNGLTRTVFLHLIPLYVICPLELPICLVSGIL